MKLKLLLSFILFSILFINIRCPAVCSEDELVREVREDIEDNGKLDCLRVVRSPYESEETSLDRAKRLASEWNSDCAFEALNDPACDWLPKFVKNFKLADNDGKGALYDVNGVPT